MLDDLVVRHISRCIQRYKDDQTFGEGKIPPPSPWTDVEAMPVPTEYQIPSLILWDPLNKYSHYNKNGFNCPHESHQGCAFVPVLNISTERWNDGSKERYTPRSLYDLKGRVLLVSRIYTCSAGHEFQAHDERITKMLPLMNYVPFVLSNRAGFSIDLYNTINTLASAGLPFRQIETTIAQSCFDSFAVAKRRYEADVNAYKMIHHAG